MEQVCDMTFAKLISGFFALHNNEYLIMGGTTQSSKQTFSYTLSLSCIKIEVSPHIIPLDLLT
jgi:hypothetical protein